MPSMGSDRLRDVDVEVRVDGEWWRGWLDPGDWRKDAGRWVAMVRWTRGPAQNYMATFDADNVRKV
jgi:hypothetical protein